MDERFGSWSLAAAVATMILTQEFHPLLLLLLRAGQTGAWMTALLSGTFATGLYWIVAAALARRPGGNLIDLAREAAGRTGAAVTALLLAGILVFHAGFVLREVSEMAVSSLYPHTPETFATVSLLLAAMYGAFGGTAGLVKLCRILLPYTVIGMLVILAGSTGWGKLRYLLPFWGPGPGLLAMRAVPVVSVYTPAVFLLIAAADVRDRQKLKIAGAVAIAGSSLLLALTKVVLLMAYPMPMGLSITFPLHEMSRLILGGRFFQRVEGVWLFLWVLTTDCFLAALLHTAARAFAEAFNMPSHKPAVLPLVAVALTLAFFAPDQGEALRWHNAAAPVGTAIAFALPVILTLLTLVRRRAATRGT